MFDGLSRLEIVLGIIAFVVIGILYFRVRAYDLAHPEIPPKPDPEEDRKGLIAFCILLGVVAAFTVVWIVVQRVFLPAG